MFYLRCKQNGAIVGRDNEGYPIKMTASSGAINGYATKQHAEQQLVLIRDWVFASPNHCYGDYTWEVVRQCTSYEVV